MAKLYFYYAAMNAGKSTTLLQADFNYRERGMRTLLFTAAFDDRFEPGKITSRIGLASHATAIDSDTDLFEEVAIELAEAAVHCVLVDEAQWLTRAQVFQLAGNVKQGGIVELPFGVSLRELVEEYGGGTLSGRPVRAAQVGGPLGAYVPATGFQVAMDYEAMTEAGAMLGHGGVVVFDETVDMARMARFAMEFCSIESCGKCTPCRVGSTRGVETIDRIIAGQDVPANLVLLDDLCETMTKGSLCAMGGLTPMPVQSAIRHFPEDFEPRGTERSGAPV